MLQDVLVETVKGFAASGGEKADLDVILAEAQRDRLGDAFIAQLKAKAGKGVDVSFDDGVRFGFRVAPEGGGYQFDFTGDGFKEIFLRFLAPRFRTYFYEKQ